MAFFLIFETCAETKNFALCERNALRAILIAGRPVAW
jgi:hypothetical protein